MIRSKTLTACPMTISEQLQKNLSAIFDDIRSACDRAERDVTGVKLVAVTKYADWEWVQELSRLHFAFGENRPQQLAERQPKLPDVEWHLIGQLQRNKVRSALEHASWIHSIDSMRLLERVAETAASLHLRPRLLLQVNVSGESSKSGFAVDEIEAEWPMILKFVETVAVEGLMTMAAETDDPELARPAFRILRQTRDRLADREDSKNANVALPQLSMGMSGDFIQAIEEGATFVRIGSRVFEGLSAD